MYYMTHITLTDMVLNCRFHYRCNGLSYVVVNKNALIIQFNSICTFILRRAHWTLK